MKVIAIIIASLVLGLTAAGSTAVAAPSSTEVAVGTTTFTYPRLVATFMVNGLNAKPNYDNVRATSVTRYRIVLKGLYEYEPFTAHLTKVGRTKIRITLYSMGQHLSQVADIGFNV